MRLLATAATLLCVLLAAPAAGAGAPARPFDFERAVPSASSQASAASVRTVRTARRFHLVGLLWRGRAQPAVRLRAHRPGRGWSRWQRLGSHAHGGTDPVWVGGARVVQYRLSERVRGLRLHFVNVASARRGLRARAAQEPEPDFVSRAEWGAGQCPPRAAPDYGSVRAVHVHHTVSLNDYAPEESPAIVLAICRFHRNGNGWNDIGYNALVDKYGVLFEGRAGGLDQAVIGAQAQGFNAQTAGIASIADHTSVGATPQTLAALARYLRWKLGVHGQPLSGAVTLTSAGGSASRYPAGSRVSLERVIGHRDTGRTACPGELLYDQLEELRTMVTAGVAGVPSYTTRLSATLADLRVRSGDRVPLTGLLSGPGGTPLSGRPLAVQTSADGFWRSSAELVTGAGGTFATELRPRKRMYVLVRFGGATGLRRASSRRLLLGVSARLTLRRPVAASARGERVRVFGLVKPRKRLVRLVVARRRGGRYRRVAGRAVRVRSGRFATSFAPGVAGDYRYAVVAPSDDDTDRGSTGWRPLSVR